MFSQKDLELLQQLAELYVKAKGLILYSEEIDPESRSNLQVIKELRDSHDHVMRVLYSRLTKNQSAGLGDTDQYCETNLDKAVGHVYRAAFDALDGTTLSIREKIASTLNEYPSEVIKEVLPNYWGIRVKLDELCQNIADHRAAKDVGGHIGGSFDKYVDDIESVKAFHKSVLIAGPSLDECKLRLGREKKRAHFTSIAKQVVAGVILVAVTYYFSLPNGSASQAQEHHQSKQPASAIGH